MKLLELAVDNLCGAPDGAYSFAEADGSPRDVVVLVGGGAGVLLETIAALFEALRAGARAPTRSPGGRGDAGPGRRGSAFAGRFRRPRPRARIAERDIAATQVRCRPGVGLVAWKTPDALAELSRAIAPILPALRLERVACDRGGMPVACFRGEQRVELNQLDDAERDAIYIVAALHTAKVRDGVVLVDSPVSHVPREQHARWLGWLAGVVAPNQLFAAMSVSAPTEQALQDGRVVRTRANVDDRLEPMLRGTEASIHVPRDVEAHVVANVLAVRADATGRHGDDRPVPSARALDAEGEV